MYGAILGDIIGSPFEFDRGAKTKDFELFTKGCQFTDDSVMTAAIAEATASCIFLARHGVNKDGIKEYVIKEFGYDLNRTLDEIRPTYHHVESCQQTVPEAIIAFLESENFEDAVRNAVSLGGDTDTLAAITGSIAEAFYDMSAILRAECRNRVSKDILNVMQLFDEAIGRRVHNSDEYENLSENAAIETAIHQMYAKDDKNSFVFLLTILCSRMKSKGHVLVSFVTVGEEESRRKQCGNVIMSIPLYDLMEILYKILPIIRDWV